jgi:sulfur relay (sulfurtransferase) DsrC/TusE family protein
MNQKKFGLKVELEHKKTFNFIKNYYKKKGVMPSNTAIAGKIVQDHLKEKKNYYSLLKKAKL